MVLHILKITPRGVTVEWLSGKQKNYWVKKIFVVLPTELRLYAAELVYQAAQFNELEKLNNWQFIVKGVSARALLTRVHSRILTRRAKARWYWQWLKQFFQKEKRRIMKKEIHGFGKGSYGLLKDEQDIIIGCYASDGIEKFCGQQGCTMAPGMCAASGPAQPSH